MKDMNKKVTKDLPYANNKLNTWRNFESFLQRLELK